MKFEPEKEKEVIFYNETTLGGKIQIMTTKEISGEGILKTGKNYIHAHKGVIHKRLFNYWLDKKAFEKLKKENVLERTVF